MKITHEQFMEVAIAGFGRDDWKYDSRDLFESIESIVPDMHKLFVNGSLVLSIYSPNDNYVEFNAPKSNFNQLVGIQKMIELKLLKSPYED